MPPPPPRLPEILSFIILSPPDILSFIILSPPDILSFFINKVHMQQIYEAPQHSWSPPPLRASSSSAPPRFAALPINHRDKSDIVIIARGKCFRKSGFLLVGSSKNRGLLDEEKPEEGYLHKTCKSSLKSLLLKSVYLQNARRNYFLCQKQVSNENSNEKKICIQEISFK